MINLRKVREKMGLSDTAYARRERGEVLMVDEEICRLSEKCYMTYDELFTL